MHRVTPQNQSKMNDSPEEQLKHFLGRDPSGLVSSYLEESGHVTPFDITIGSIIDCDVMLLPWSNMMLATTPFEWFRHSPAGFQMPGPDSTE